MKVCDSWQYCMTGSALSETLSQTGFLEMAKSISPTGDGSAISSSVKIRQCLVLRGAGEYSTHLKPECQASCIISIISPHSGIHLLPGYAVACKPCASVDGLTIFRLQCNCDTCTCYSASPYICYQSTAMRASSAVKYRVQISFGRACAGHMRWFSIEVRLFLIRRGLICGTNCRHLTLELL